MLPVTPDVAPPESLTEVIKRLVTRAPAIVTFFDPASGKAIDDPFADTPRGAEHREWLMVLDDDARSGVPSEDEISDSAGRSCGPRDADPLGHQSRMKRHPDAVMEVSNEARVRHRSMRQPRCLALEKNGADMPGCSVMRPVLNPDLRSTRPHARAPRGPGAPYDR